MARNPLDIIEYAESKGKNVPNYKFGPGFTAQGYYQITNPTWRDHARAAGVDLSRYPTAMSAPKEMQRAVAADIFKKRGFQPWEAVKHLRGQEKNYSVGAAPQETARAAGPKTMPGTVPLPPERPAPAVAQAAKALTIAQLQEQLLAKYPELRVTSGYRDPEHNRRVGGARNSQHTHGTAIDVSLKGIEEARQREIIETARSLGARGLGYYPKSQSAHFDVRQGAPAAWGQNYSRTSLPQTPGWFQEVAAQHLKGGGAPTQVASNLSPGAPSPAADPGIPTLPKDPVEGLIGQTSDPWADMLAEREKEQQAQQKQAQAPVAPPPPQPAPPTQMPAAPPIDYSTLLMPRLRRGLLADQGYGLLA